MSTIESIKCSLDQSEITYGVLMDLSRAFDCVPYKLLIAKFRRYDVYMWTSDVISNYLIDPSQHVNIEIQINECIHVLLFFCLVHLVIMFLLMT